MQEKIMCDHDIVQFFYFLFLSAVNEYQGQEVYRITECIWKMYITVNAFKLKYMFLVMLEQQT